MTRFGGGFRRGGQRAYDISATLRAAGGSPCEQVRLITSTRHIRRKAGTARGWVSSLLPSSQPHVQGSLVTPVSLERKCLGSCAQRSLQRCLSPGALSPLVTAVCSHLQVPAAQT